MTPAQVADAIDKAVEEAGTQGEGAEVRVEIKVEAPTDAPAVEITIPKPSVDRAAEGDIQSLAVSTPVASITFDAAALSTISGEAPGDVKIAAAKVDVTTLPEEAQQVVGDRPVFSFSVTSGSKTISEFGGNVEVSVPYIPKPEEDPNSIVIYYVNAEGELELVSDCVFDPATGTVRFTTNHFSRYAVGYNKVTFKDVPTDNFADAGDTYYTGYLAAAKRLGISNGVGDNLYAPDREITRQEMFTLLYNTLKLIGRLPTGASGKGLADFGDSGQIAPWASEPMTLFVETGVVQGSEGMLNPEAWTTRAEMAQILYNLVARPTGI